MKWPQISKWQFVAWLTICSGGGALIYWLSGMPWWAAFLIIAAALMVNSLVAEVEDQDPPLTP